MVKYKFDPTFQLHILALLVTSKHFGSVYREVIKPDYFDLESHQGICEIALDFIKSYCSPPTQISLSACADRAGKPKLKRVIEKLYNGAISEVELAFARDCALEFAREQKTKMALRESVSLLHSEENENRYEDIAKLITEATRKNEVDDLGKFLFADIDKHAHSWQLDLGDPVATLWREVDEKLGGGVFPKTLNLLLGATSIGKTAALVNLAVAAAAQGKTVFFYTCEMSDTRSLMRMVSRLTGKESDTLKHEGVAGIQDTILRVKKIGRMFGGEILIKEYPTGAASVDDIRSHIDSVLEHTGYSPGVLIVDYGDILRHEGFRERRHQIGATFTNLRRLGVELDVPVWSATQTNRHGLVKETPGIEDAAEDLEKIRVSDTVLVLCQTKKEREEGKLRVYGDKVRDAVKGWTANIKIDFARMLLVDEQIVQYYTEDV